MERPSRRPGNDKQRQRAALLASIAEKRNAKSGPREVILLDSSEDEAEQGHRSGLLQDTSESLSSLDVQDIPTTALRRIQKRAAGSTADAAADSLAGLKLSQQADSLDGNPDSKYAATPPSTRLSPGTPSEPEEAAMDARSCAGLVLGEKSEFKLIERVSQLLYSHQV